MVAIPLLEHWGVPGTWNPYLLTPSIVKGWWSAQDHGTALMTDDGSGLISSWKSRTGDANAITAATTARATWTANAFNTSYPGLTFDGVANCYATTTLTNLPTGSTAREVWMVLQQTAGVTCIAMNYGGTAASTGMRMLGSTAYAAVVNDNTTNLVNANGNTLQTPTIFGGSLSGTTSAGRLGGTAFVSATGTIASLNTGTTRFRLGSSNATTAASFFPGVISECLFTTALTLAQEQLIEGYLAWQYWPSAAANPLPSDHPYKNSAP